jgi:hypothetical protein
MQVITGEYPGGLAPDTFFTPNIGGEEMSYSLGSDIIKA